MDNHIYNLMKAIVKKSQSVWHYEKYLQDSQGCNECQQLWQKMKSEDERHLEEMKTILKHHLELLD